MEEKIDHSWLRQASTDSNQVKDIYDKWASTYDETLSAWGYKAPAQAAKILRGEVLEGASVLDVGCGTGLTGEALRSVGLSGRIDGIDVSPASLAEAKSKGHYDSLAEVNLQSLPLPIDDGVYDALLCVGVLTYISNDAEVLREFARVVRGRGTIVITQRTDLYSARNYEGLLDGMRDVVEEVSMTGPYSYLPLNEQYGSAIETIFVRMTVK
ncbi:MAG: class I SAM-dependent methyltransferase [Devosia sp.]